LGTDSRGKTSFCCGEVYPCKECQRSKCVNNDLDGIALSHHLICVGLLMSQMHNFVLDLKGNLFSLNPSKIGPTCLHAEISTALNPLPNHAYDVVTLIKNHNQRIIHEYPFNPQSGLLPLDTKLPNELMSNKKYSFVSLPQCLRRQFGIENNELKKSVDLIECMTDEISKEKVYTVRFQVVDCIFIQTQDESLRKHLVLEVRDKTGQIALIVPFNTSTYTKGSTTTNEEEMVCLALKDHVFESTIKCTEMNQTKFFLLVGDLKGYSV
jgi:hypothetical protein